MPVFYGQNGGLQDGQVCLIPLQVTLLPVSLHPPFPRLPEQLRIVPSGQVRLSLHPQNCEMPLQVTLVPGVLEQEEGSFQLPHERLEPSEQLVCAEQHGVSQ